MDLNENQNQNKNQITKIPFLLKIIENYGPVFVMILSIFTLFKKKFYLFFYVIGIMFNTTLNYFLKFIINEPRPSDLINKKDKTMNLAVKHGILYPIIKYGMPSGHAQNLGFSLGFMFLFIQNSLLLWIFIITSIVTMYERFNSLKHSLIQLTIGFIIGIIVGFMFYKLSSNYIKGNLKKKIDDYTFI